MMDPNPPGVMGRIQEGLSRVNFIDFATVNWHPCLGLHGSGLILDFFNPRFARDRCYKAFLAACDALIRRWL